MPPVSSTSYLRWGPALGWMALIFAGSTNALSHEHTSRFVEPFLRWLSHGKLSPDAIEQIHFLIRKTGHLCEYTVLCLLDWWALRPILTTGRRAGWSIFLAACFAATDEFHQSFVPSRGASIRDVVIDTIGAAVGLGMFLALDKARMTLRAIRNSGQRQTPAMPAPAARPRRPDKS